MPGLEVAMDRIKYRWGMGVGRRDQVGMQTKVMVMIR